MFHQKESVFRDKFNSLYTPEETEEINWSSRSSSDFETNNKHNTNLLNKSNGRKRKRKVKKQKNISYLDVTIIDVPDSGCQKSPVFNESKNKTVFINTSPILTTRSISNLNSNARTPILSQQDLQRSPLLTQKGFRSAERLKKRLFFSESSKITAGPEKAEKSPVIASKTKNYLVNIKPKSLILSPNIAIKSEMALTGNSKIISEKNYSHQPLPSKRPKHESHIFNTDTFKREIKEEKPETKEAVTNVTIKNEPKAMEQLPKNKLYFNNQFSSESPSQSQPSITDTQTPQNEIDAKDILIVSTLTQNPSKINSDIIDNDSSKTSMESIETDLAFKSKKVKYKKNSLAFRLNNLLKKQSASISLWQHEQYLAGSTSFVIPKREFSIFRLRKVLLEFGCYLLDAIDLNDESFLILINKKYVMNNISNEFIIKVYEPYSILESLFGIKVVLNVCKFEFLTLDDIM